MSRDRGTQMPNCALQIKLETRVQSKSVIQLSLQFSAVIWAVYIISIESLALHFHPHFVRQTEIGLSTVMGTTVD